MELSWKKTSGLFVFGKISHPRTSFPSLFMFMRINQTFIILIIFLHFSGKKGSITSHESSECGSLASSRHGAPAQVTTANTQHCLQVIRRWSTLHCLGSDLMIMLLGDRRHAHGHALWPLSLLGDWAQRQRGLGQSSVSQSVQWVDFLNGEDFFVPKGAQGLVMSVRLSGTILLWLSIFMFLVQIFKKTSRWLQTPCSL